MKLWIANLTLSCLLLACRETVTGGKNSVAGISVHCLLLADNHPQKIVLYHATDRLSELIPPKELFVEGALVFIEGEFQKVQFRYHVDQYHQPSYIDLPDTLSVVPGGTYRLTVESDLGTIHGLTRLPEAFRVINPDSGNALQRNHPLTVCWSSSSRASGYVVNLIHPPPGIPRPPDSTQLWRAVYSVTVFDTTYRMPVHLLQEPGKYLLKVMAFEKQFKQHFYQGMDRSGIEGGWGFFGAAVVDTLPFRIKE